MDKGNDIGVQEAADILKGSRMYLVKLLGAGLIPFCGFGGERRLKLEDVRAFKERERAARKNALEELSEEGQRLNLGE